MHTLYNAYVTSKMTCLRPKIGRVQRSFDLMLSSYIILARPCKHSDVYGYTRRVIRLDFWISKWISGFQSGFLDFKVDFWISEWISGFRWISGFQNGFLPTVYEISFVADPSRSRERLHERLHDVNVHVNVFSNVYVRQNVPSNVITFALSPTCFMTHVPIVSRK